MKSNLSVIALAAVLGSTPAFADSIKGEWSDVTQFDFIPIHAVTLPDGRVLTYGGTSTGDQGGHQSYDIWDPSRGTGPDSHTKLPNTTNVDSFCSAMLLAPQSGRVITISGDSRGRNRTVRNRDVLAYDWRDNSVTKLDRGINRQRWYGTPVMMGNGDIMMIAGTCWGSSSESCTNSTRHMPEIYNEDTGWRYLTGTDNDVAKSAFNDDNTWWYPRAFLTNEGNVYTLSMGHEQRMIAASGDGVIWDFPDRNDDHFGSTNSAVMYRPDQILVTGGGGYDSNGKEPDGSSVASNIDLSTNVPVWTKMADMNLPRQWHSSTVLPDGKVLVTGGSKTNNVLEGVALEPEIWDPDTNQWTLMDAAPEARLYHSSAVLLPDGRVMTGGGGAPGPLTQTNGAAFSPPYLFKPGMNNRLEVNGGPEIIEPYQDATFMVNDGSRVSRMTMVGYGGATHSFNFGQRFNELPFTRNGNDITVQLPDNENYMPPGYYMIFALDANDVPSMAYTVRVLRSDTAASPDQEDLPDANFFGTGQYVPQAAPVGNGSNLLLNPSFENNTVRDGSYQLGTLTGWNGGTETWKNLGGLSGTDGESWIELDTTGGVSDEISQSFNTVSGETYEFSFDYAPRIAIGEASNRMEVVWNGDVIGTIARSGVGDTQIDWSKETFSIVGTGGIDTIALREAGGSDGLGIMIDNTSFMLDESLISNLNGSFETNSVAPGNYRIAVIPGWTGTPEVWNSLNGYVADTGDSWTELDAGAAVVDTLSKSYNIPENQTVALTFAESPRPNVSAASNAFEVLWNGQVIDTISRNGNGLNALSWNQHSYTVTGRSGSDTLAFRELSTDGLGAMLDSVLITAEASTSNGSFEDNNVATGGYGIAAISGWIGNVEVWNSHNGYTANDGVSWAELDITAGIRDTLTRNFETTSGTVYEVSFAEAPRPGVTAASNGFEVLWNGTVIDTISRDGRNLNSLAWQIQSYEVTGTGGSNSFGLRELTTDGLGAMIDNVQFGVSTGTGTGTGTGNADLNVNGGFEDNSVAPGRYGTQALANWNGQLEVWNNHNGVQAYEGNSYVELDAAMGPSTISRTYQTEAGQGYALSFAHLPRPGINAASNQFRVLWNGTEIANISVDNANSTESWRTYSYNVTATGNDTLTFEETDADGLGALIDAVSLQ